jgi:hypothetical protein
VLENIQSNGHPSKDLYGEYLKLHPQFSDVGFV